jgi:C-terminal processing protease CtpA/Prc
MFFRSRAACWLALGSLVLTRPVLAQDANSFQQDALALEGLINDNYAYLDRFPGSKFPMNAVLRAEAQQVRDRDGLLRFAEDMLTALADHHAITGPSFKDDWAIVPSYCDLWIVRSGENYSIDAVRDGSPALKAGVARGDLLQSVNGQPIGAAVAQFWQRVGWTGTIDDERAGFAARVLAAGRRDRARQLAIARGKAAPRNLTLANLYADQPQRPPVDVFTEGGTWRIRYNNSLGDDTTVAAFDAAMAKVPANATVIVDLRDTPSGGNSTVARAMMGWFTDKAQSYQMHNSPREFRETGVDRQWIEQVVPRGQNRFHPGPISALVGRWTGSMGEGMAVGLHALGKPVHGTAMAGLRGAIEDLQLPHSGMTIKLPIERIYTVDGLPREDFVPGG